MHLTLHCVSCPSSHHHDPKAGERVFWLCRGTAYLPRVGCHLVTHHCYLLIPWKALCKLPLAVSHPAALLPVQHTPKRLLACLLLPWGMESLSSSSFDFSLPSALPNPSQGSSPSPRWCSLSRQIRVPLPRSDLPRPPLH